MMHISSQRLAQALTYCGTLPFIAGLVWHFMPLAAWDERMICALYGAVIVSFLCGLHWAVYLFFADQCPLNLFITSNVIALLAWLSVLVPDVWMSELVQIASFSVLCALDFKLRSLYPRWFYPLRQNATLIVVFCLVVLMVAP
jgi:hypothetical protein